ncbi:hypothetical protein GobsT_50110 [Gemmata obscuriglobus]|uniref:Uncharacterized protein n=1 Tax=Gemmata obscuriglobus TaxID=114 RepID=A0A2Z3H0G4_9BACT|nr:hypothetical protein [Gemmata obscuriglobus]AWM37076.1 hypothetical protein C1280_08595 [Gemmata obscuriglobus]QEG30208.1 hypothetical protein GobsT_50110 [Gemmata obscuriglobus]VTS09532.1 unnamed protein product [Gemmata obscuriglobus UQM 2246]
MTTPTPLLQRVAAAIRKVPLSISSTRRSGENGLRNAEEVAQAALDACHAEELTAALRVNDSVIRDIRQRDARWHDDELVKQLLERNRALLAKLEGRS